MFLLISLFIFIIVISIHEFSHGLMALKFGDNTAKNAGRLTLNPVAHIDVVGTVMLPLLLVFARSPVIFGWAKPVPINPYNFNNPRMGLFFTGLAGPLSNFLLAAMLAILFKLNILPDNPLVIKSVLTAIIISLILGIFNLIPIPPLDGANMVFSLLPNRVIAKIAPYERYGFIVIIAALYLGIFERVILPLVDNIMRFLI